MAEHCDVRIINDGTLAGRPHVNTKDDTALLGRQKQSQGTCKSMLIFLWEKLNIGFQLLESPEVDGETDMEE